MRMAQRVALAALITGLVAALGCALYRVKQLEQDLVDLQYRSDACDDQVMALGIPTEQ